MNVIDASRPVSIAELLAAHQVDVVPLLALSPEQAAGSIGVSRNFFDKSILPELRIVYRGRKRIIPVRELNRWLEENAARAIAR